MSFECVEAAARLLEQEDLSIVLAEKVEAKEQRKSFLPYLATPN